MKVILDISCSGDSLSSSMKSTLKGLCFQSMSSGSRIMLPIDAYVERIMLEWVKDIPLLDKLCLADRRVITYLAWTWKGCDVQAYALVYRVIR